MASTYIKLPPDAGGGPAAGVDSFNGRTGVVVSQSGDYSAALISITPAGNISATNTQAAINELDTEKEAAGTAASTMASHVAALDPHPQYALDSDLSAKMDKSANLSDVASVATSRTNLGLGNAATKNVGTTAGTVASGDDPRLSDSRPPTGSAGGDLDGIYPGPTLGLVGTAGTYGSDTAIPIITTDTKGRVTAVSTIAPTLSGAAGGDLTGNYPNPSLTTTGVVAGTYGTSSQIPAVTVDAKGRITTVSSIPVQVTSSATTDFTTAAQSAAVQNALAPASTVKAPSVDATNTGLAARVAKTGDTMSGALSFTDTVGSGYVEFPPQSVIPAAPSAGFRAYSGSTGRLAFRGALNGGIAWSVDYSLISAIRTFTLPDQSGTITIDPTTTTGDTLYNSGGVLNRLPIGTTNQVLTVSGGVPTWMDSITNGFGDGSTGSATITGSTTLTGPAYYDTLTISGAGSINTNGYPLYCKTLDLSNAGANAITCSGNNGNSSTGSAGGGAPGANTSAYLGGAGNGAAGGASSTTTGSQGSAGTAQNPGNGGSSGASGAGGTGAGGAGGANRPAAATQNSITFGMLNPSALFMRNTSIILGGASGGGGGGGGGSSTQAGTGGGSGGSGGGVMAIFAKTLITSGSTASGAISSKGGNGGNGGNVANANTGGGGGGGGAGGGYIYLAYQVKSGSAVTNLIDASGGNGGNGGNGNGTGLGGNGAAGGVGGNIDIYNAATRTGAHVAGSAGSAGNAGSGTTGGAGGSGGSCVYSL